MANPRKDIAPYDRKRGLADNVVGENFYVKKPEIDFLKRVKSWVNYLGIDEFFPNIDELADRIREVGSNMRSAGDASFLGLASKLTYEVLIRPGDYATLLHELTHVNRELEGTLIPKEAGAFAIEIHACGDFDSNLNILFASDSYKSRDKRLGRIISEASIVLGVRIFQYLSGQRSACDEVTIAKQLGEMVNDYEQIFLKNNNMSAADYLTTVHKVTPFIATLILQTTKDTKQTILRSTSRHKKEFIGAFKALTSFYHINLGYTLKEAIAKTEEHFRQNEAMTIQKTLLEGPKEVFAKLKEYGYGAEVYQKIAEFMISKGPSLAKGYAEGLPKFIELTGTFGRRGIDILGFALMNPTFLDAMVLSKGAEGLLKLSVSEPEQVMLIMDELMKYDWRHQLRLECNMDIVYAYEKQAMYYLSPREKAKAAAVSMFIISVPLDIVSKFPVNLPSDMVFPTPGRVSAWWACEKICTKLMQSNKKEESLDALIKIVKSAYLQALPASAREALPPRRP
nr:hypothetical protein [Candidatus Sigynarchaeota archaeon]